VNAAKQEMNLTERARRLGAGKEKSFKDKDLKKGLKEFTAGPQDMHTCNFGPSGRAKISIDGHGPAIKAMLAHTANLGERTCQRSPYHHEYNLSS